MNKCVCFISFISLSNFVISPGNIWGLRVDKHVDTFTIHGLLV